MFSLGLLRASNDDFYIFKTASKKKKLLCGLAPLREINDAVIMKYFQADSTDKGFVLSFNSFNSATMIKLTITRKAHELIF